MKKTQQLHTALLLTVITGLCFALPAPILKATMDEISPPGALAVRFFVAALLFPLIVYLWGGKKRIIQVFTAKQTELTHFFILSLVLAGSIITLFLSFLYMEANRALLIFMAYPMVDSVGAWIFLREKMSKADIGCGIFTAVGSFFLFGNGLGAKSHIVGDMLIITATILFAVYLILSRKIGEKYEYYKRTTWLFIFAFFFFCIAFYATESTGVLTQLSPLTWSLLVILGIFGTVLPYMCLSYATAYVKSSVVSVILLLGNILSIGLVSWIFGEVITRNMWIGGGLIIVGFLITTIAEWEHEAERVRHHHH